MTFLLPLPRAATCLRLAHHPRRLLSTGVKDIPPLVTGKDLDRVGQMWHPEEIAKLQPLVELETKIEAELPGRSIASIRQRVSKLREGRGNGIFWTPDKYEIFRAHPTAFYGVSEEELFTAFPGASISGIQSQLRDWRRLHGVKQTDFSRLSPFSEDEFLRFKKHPTNLYGCSPEECLEVFPGKSLFSIVSQLRIWRRKLGLKCPPELFGAKNFKEEDLQKIRDHPTLFSGYNAVRLQKEFPGKSLAAIRRNIKNVTNGKVKVKVKKKEVRNSVRQAVLKEKVANGTATKLEKMQVLEHWEDSPELAEKKAVVEGGDGWKAHWGDVFEWPQTKELEES